MPCLLPRTAQPHAAQRNKVTDLKTELLVCATSVLCGLGAPLWASCPVADDLYTGIRFTIDGGHVETFTQMRPGFVESVWEEGDYVGWMDFAKGVYIMEQQDLDSDHKPIGDMVHYTFETVSGVLPAPEPGGGFSAKVVVIRGGEQWTETHDYRFGQEAINTIGGCDYRMIPVEVRYGGDIVSSVDYLRYLPELGITYIAGFESDGERTDYYYSSIEVVQ
ncbi:hypothetical protein SAMN05216376_10373 [Mameliella alba]|nr:hypothetical protein LX94_01501 [Mameliella alba]SDC55740.1 hypothetical protein SAMN05216376_10373 [Mameliella alba]